MQRDGTAALAAAHRVWARLEDVMNLIAAAAIFFLMFVGVFQVIGRTVFNTAIHGYIDYMEQASALFAFLGISYAQRVGAHIRMDLLLRGFSLRFLWAMELFAVLVALVIITVLVDTTWENFLRAWQLGDSTIDIGLPIWPTKLLVPVVLAILWVRLVLQIARLHAPGPPSRRRADRRAGDRDHRGAGPARDRGSAWPRGEAAMSIGTADARHHRLRPADLPLRAGRAHRLCRRHHRRVRAGHADGLRARPAHGRRRAACLGRELHAERAADVHPDRLSRLLRRHHPGGLRGGAALARLDAGRARHRHRLCRRGLLGRLGRQHRGRRGVRQGGDPRDAEGGLQQAPGGGRGRGRRHARFADPAQRAAGHLRHHHRAVGRQAPGRGLRAGDLLGPGLYRDHPGHVLAQSRARQADQAATPGRSASSRCPARCRSSW